MGLSTKIANWASASGVFTNAINAIAEFRFSGSYDQAPASLYDVMNELTSSTVYSGSVTRFTASAVIPANHPQLERIHTSLLPSFYRQGSSILHYDEKSGSGAFVSASFYDIPKGVHHAQSMSIRFGLIEDAFEYKMDQNIAIKKTGQTSAENAASASLKATMDTIKAL
jgi:hypothetical protein